MKKRVLALVSALLMMTCLFGSCGGQKATSGEFGFQLNMPEEGEEVAVMHTTMGDIYIRLFPDQAPKTVENFKTHAQNGYYDGLIFHRVINNFMIQGGDPTGTGTGGESIWGSKFGDEFDPSLGNLTGSLAMANAGENTNGSQFFINQSGIPGGTVADGRAMYDQNKAMIDQYYGNFESFIAERMGLDKSKVTAAIVNKYAEVGGNIHLDGPLRESGGHTVFGQVYDGMDVVNAIAAVETNADDKPLEDVKIVSIEFMPYTAN